MSVQSKGSAHLPSRSYHHGNLATALLHAGVELARDSGPDAVVLREAARRVGVSATAAYRHFENQGALVEAVKEEALKKLGEHMEAALERQSPLRIGETPGVARLVAIGRAYLDFALTEPGLFRTFCLCLPVTGDVLLDAETPTFGVLARVLAELAADGSVEPEVARNSAIPAWAIVHGLAVLYLDGPLTTVPSADQEAIFDAAMHMVLRGLLVR